MCFWKNSPHIRGIFRKGQCFLGFCLKNLSFFKHLKCSFFLGNLRIARTHQTQTCPNFSIRKKSQNHVTVISSQNNPQTILLPSPTPFAFRSSSKRSLLSFHCWRNVTWKLYSCTEKMFTFTKSETQCRINEVQNRTYDIKSIRTILTSSIFSKLLK